jgi:hypothetical protein
MFWAWTGDGSNAEAASVIAKIADRHRRLPKTIPETVISEKLARAKIIDVITANCRRTPNGLFDSGCTVSGVGGATNRTFPNAQAVGSNVDSSCRSATSACCRIATIACCRIATSAFESSDASTLN